MNLLQNHDATCPHCGVAIADGELIEVSVDAA
jgi:hypothetical protein